MSTFSISELENRMNNSVENLKLNYQGIRSGRASTGLVDNLIVEAYGQSMKIKDLATVSVPEARTIKINVWDTNLVNFVEKSILNSSLSLTPMTEGQVVRINLPELTSERRTEYAKNIRSLAEDAKIAIRNIRQDVMNATKKNSEGLPEDEIKNIQEEIQKSTDKFTDIINTICKNKENEIMQI